MKNFERMSTKNVSASEFVAKEVREMASQDKANFYTKYGTVMQQYDRPEYICGWGAAFVNICATFPMNKVMFRQQLHGVRALKAMKQLKKEGMRQLYRGLMPPLLQKTTSLTLMFGLYYEFQRGIGHYFPDLWLPANKATAAMLSGTIEAILTPFERVQILMQDKNYQHRFVNTFHAFKDLRKNHGIAEFYRGQSAILLRNGPSNVLFFLGRDYLKQAYPDLESNSEKYLLDFLSGAVLGAFISTVFYPVNVVKVRMQSSLSQPFCKVIPTARKILEERNYSIKKLFRGVHMNYSRAFVSWGIVNATYEYLMHFFKDERDASDGS